MADSHASGLMFSSHCTGCGSSGGSCSGFDSSGLAAPALVSVRLAACSASANDDACRKRVRSLLHESEITFILELL